MVMDHVKHVPTIELLDSLDRSLQELEALQAIYEDGVEGTDHLLRLTVKTLPEVIEQARTYVEDCNTSLTIDNIPTLSLELQLNLQNTDGNSTTDSSNVSIEVCVGFRLPPAYPSHQPLSVAVLTTRGLSKTMQQELSHHLQSMARELVGSEAIIALVQACQEQVGEFFVETKQLLQERELDSGDCITNDHSNSPALSRRWIWVHHITNRQRKDDIVEEANNFQLGGYLKAGYPGVVVVEGSSSNCDNFVTFIKGNKSRPGGFGRQWGHHVRGEVDIHQRQLPSTFIALEEDLSILALNCRERGLEDEFKRFVMQHG